MKVLVTNVFGDSNKGDKALIECLISKLRRFGAETISLVATFNENLNSIEGVDRIHRPVHRLNINKKILVPIYPFIIVSSILYSKFPKWFFWIMSKEQKNLLDEYREANLIISCPGGFLEDSNRSYYLNLFQLYLALIQNKRFVIAPQSIGPISSWFGRSFLRNILSQADMIFVRELNSYDFVKNNLRIKENKLMLSADLAFFLDVKDSPISRDSEVIYSTVVDWTFPNSSDKRKSRNQYIDSMMGIFKYVNQKFGKKIVLLNQVSTDLEICFELEKKLPEIVSVDTNSYTPQEMVTMIAATDFFIGTRFHSCIFAMLQSIPFLAISYLPKTKGILKWMKLDDCQIDIYELKSQSAIAKLNEVIANPSTPIEIRDKVQLMREQDHFSKFLRNILAV